MQKVRDKIIFHIISHTHWDREWYLPFEVFRLELVELIDNLLDILEQNNNFIFHLDGQMILLQDYLEIKPYKKEQIKKFVQSGNLLIGPWYVLSDQFLTSGEATIRNLLYGLDLVGELGLGNVMLVGYLPDQFGQVAQLPQILKGFNMHSAIIGRGIQDSINEHNWYGLNGDKILAISLTHWYNNAQRFPEEKEKLHKYLDKIYATQARMSLSKHVFLMNGCDHLFAQSNLPKLLKIVNENEKWQLQQDSLPKAMDSILRNGESTNYPICFGELRSDNNKYILAGTLSSRVYLKLANYNCQTKLEKIIEPLAALLVLNGKTKYPYDELKYAWKLLIQNHAHDSICGCSIDEVHKEMEIRFLKVNQVLEKLKENLLLHLCNVETPRRGSTEKQYLQLINLTNYHRNGAIEAEIEFPLGPPAEHSSAEPTINKNEIKDFILKLNSKNIDFEILENHKTYKMVRSKDEVPLLQAIQRIKILFQADLEPFSICSLEIVPQVDMLQHSISAGVKNKTSALEYENKNYKIGINKDGTISVLLKGSKHKFKKIHYFSIEDDLGDEYNFMENKKNKLILSTKYKWDIKVTEENNFRKRFLLLSKNLQELEIETEITCYKHSNRIDFKTKINNHLKNKRVRLHFPVDLNTNHISADTPFGVLLRARPPIDWVNYAASQPLHNWIDHNNSHYGLGFFGGGLADYELKEDNNGFAITLFRSVGRLSTTKSHSLIQTPDAQCNREFEFNYAVYPHSGDWQSGNIQNESLIYQSPLVINQSGLQIGFSNLIEVSPELLLSSLKRSENKEKLYILRLFNPYNKDFDNLRLKLNFPVKKVSLLKLNEEEETVFKETRGQINFQAKPHQMLTFGLEV